MFSQARPRSFVCLSVCVQDYSKMRARIWMKCCVSTDVGTWTDCLTFEPNLDHSPIASSDIVLQPCLVWRISLPIWHIYRPFSYQSAPN